MKKYILICIICFWGIKSYGQLLEDKANFYIAYQSGCFAGSETFNDQGTISPSFYSNLNTNHGLVIKELLRLTPNTGIGVKLGFLSSTNWHSENYTSYNDSKSTMLNFHPVLRVNSRFRKNELYNRLKLYGEISPFVGWSMLSIKNNMFDINGFEIFVETFDSNNIISGVEAGVGCEYAFTNKTGAFIDFSVQEGFVNSPFFLDSNYTLITLNIGVRISCSKIKRFNY
jgi:hypothetical protein